MDETDRSMMMKCADSYDQPSSARGGVRGKSALG